MQMQLIKTNATRRQDYYWKSKDQKITVEPGTPINVLAIGNDLFIGYVIDNSRIFVNVKERQIGNASHLNLLVLMGHFAADLNGAGYVSRQCMELLEALAKLRSQISDLRYEKRAAEAAEKDRKRREEMEEMERHLQAGVILVENKRRLHYRMGLPFPCKYYKVENVTAKTVKGGGVSGLEAQGMTNVNAFLFWGSFYESERQAKKEVILEALVSGDLGFCSLLPPDHPVTIAAAEAVGQSAAF